MGLAALKEEIGANPNLEGASSIYILEDDPDLQAILTFNLQKSGYRVRCYSKAEDLLYLVESTPDALPDAIIVDINLAGYMNGYEATNYLRSKRATAKIPILMLTARGEVNDVVKGLAEGADDYVAKPFEFEVLLARLKSCMRRTEKFSSPVSAMKQKISLSEIDLDPIFHRVVIADKEIPLTVTEFGLLACLMSRPNEVLNRETLLLRIVGPNKMVTGRTIDVHIRALREKLGRKAKHVVTVRGLGYKFIP